MSDHSEGISDYIRTVQENTQKYLRDLTTENEKLCALIRTLEGHLDKERKDRQDVEARIKAIEAERRAYLERYLEVEAQNDNVAKLYAATLRLHSTISHADVLAAVHEIIINLVGSEEFAVFEMNADGSRLVRSSSFGMDAARLVPIAPGVGIIGRCAQSGESYVAGHDAKADGARSPTEAHLTACIPLVVEGVMTGAVAIYRLLGHKPQLEPVDLELFTLLGSHAATALYCTAVVETTGAPRSLHMRAAVDSAR
jgi:GAF domain